MPTIPPEPVRPSSEPKPHEQRRMAESFGADADRYDRTRPSYPDAMVQRIVAASPGLDVLDVGCGTGIASRQFQAAGCRVLGVDVDPRMADLARQNGVEAEVAKFEDWDPEGRTFDLVIAGQTWHWVDPVAGLAKAAQALRPGGRLALFWNVFNLAPEIAQPFAEVYAQALPKQPRNPWTRPAMEAFSGLFTLIEGRIRESESFGEPENWTFAWERVYTRDQWLEQVPTFGGVSELPSDQLSELLNGLGAVIDRLGGSFTMPYTTAVITAVR